MGLNEIIIVKIKDYRNDFWIVWGNAFRSMPNHTKYHSSAKRLSQNFRKQINVDHILMDEQRFDTNLKLYWVYMYESQIQTSTQSAPVSVGEKLVLNCYSSVIRKEQKILLDQLFFKEISFQFIGWGCNQLQFNVLVWQGS